jgi:hypothetical protein
MWFERFVIIVTSLHRDFLPSSWAMYTPTWVEFGMFVGTLGLFFTLFFLFAKFWPVVAIAEVKMILKKTRGGKPKEAFLPLQDYDPDIAYKVAIEGKGDEMSHYTDAYSSDPMQSGGGAETQNEGTK